jgi:hypothetical protein
MVSIVMAMSLLAAPATASDNGATSEPSLEVLAWNQFAFAALTNPTIPPAPGTQLPGAGQAGGTVAVHLAMVHNAIYLAVASRDDGHSWDDHHGRKSPFSAAAATATAAYKVLIGLDPPGGVPVPVPPFGQQLPLPDAVTGWLDVQYQTSKNAAVLADGMTAVDAGIAAGDAAAATVLQERQSDGRYGAYRFASGTSIGSWDELGPPPAPPTELRFDWLAEVKPFVINNADQFRSRGPNSLTSGAYARDYNEVKSTGRVDGNARQPEQQDVADFFNVNALELFNRTFRTIAEEHHLTLKEQARLFALLSTATADSLITCWADKGRYLFWRPVTAIRNGSNDGNRATVGEADWTPYVATPPYPDHASGYNCISGAMMFSAREFFGTNKIHFSLVKVGTNEERHYTRLTDVVDDTIDARVWQGLHFRTADVQGAKIGEKVARWVSRNYRG